MKKIEIILNKYIEMEIEDAISELIASRPSDRLRILVALLDLACDPEQSELKVSKCLTMAQMLLASPSIRMTDEDYLTWTENVILLCSRLKYDSLQVQSLTVALLISNRISEYVRFISDSTRTQLLEISKKSSIESVARLSNRLFQLINIQREKAKNTAVTKKQKYDLTNLNVKLARQNVLRDAQKDWYEDPWQWPELKWLENDAIESRLQNSGCGWTMAMDVPKLNGGVRPALVLSPQDRIAYQALADELSVVATSELPDWVYGWRVRRENPEKGQYVDNSSEWKLFTRNIHETANKYSMALRIDIRSFFETVNSQLLIRNISRQYRKFNVLERLDSYFSGWSIQRNGIGLPQRSLASSILAHIPLKSIDSYLDQISKELGKHAVTPLRWMDDIWLFSSSGSTLEAIVSEIEALLEEQGLGLNPTKTELLDSDEAVSSVFLYSSGSMENTNIELDVSVDPLKKLNLILNNIEEAPQSAWNFMTQYKGRSSAIWENQLKEFFHKSSLDELETSAATIAAFLNKTGEWRSKVSEYGTYVKRHVAAESWTVPSWGRMFPIKSDLSSSFRDAKNIFQQRFKDGIQRSLVPLAAHRLASWGPSYEAQDLLMNYLDENILSSHPFSLRASCFAALKSGISKHDVMEYAKESSDITLLNLIRSDLVKLGITSGE